MDEILKQRIIGTIVITAIAAIFIPMLFDDPIEGADNYNIELTIPSEPLNNMPQPLAHIPDSHQAVLSRPPPVHVQRQKKQIANAIKNDQHLKRWIIQVASFGQKSNALEFKEKLIAKKFTAYVDSTKSSQGRLFRLLVGPELNKKQAEKNQKRLEKIYGISTLLVAE